MTRFNEAVDESLTEALGWYSVRIEDARNLLNAVLAHDLRSPLGAIMTSLDVLLQDDSLDAQHVRSVVRARNSATRMKSMIGDLLDFTRTRLGTGLPMAVAECDMGRIVQDVIEEQKAFHPDGVFLCEISGNLTGWWDSSRMQQMIANLLENAATHGTEGSLVSVAADAVNDHITISVHNRGVIPPEVQRVIFDPLRRAVSRERDNKRGSGMGLGLYIARQIAEAHGGGITVESSEQAGTTFTVRLPRQRSESVESAGRA